MAVTAMGARLRDPQINIEFHGDDGKTLFTVFLMEIDRVELTTDQQAPAFWENIRRYMEEVPEHIPAPNWDIYGPLEFHELPQAHTPFPILKSKHEWLWTLEVTLFFPIRFVWFLISYPTEVLYYLAVSMTKCKKCSIMLLEIKSVWCKQFRRTLEAQRLARPGV